jgi:aminoglycoside phosphotransferase (APT) family kinase protein
MPISHDRHVNIEDELLPAAAHLTGPSASDVLGVAVAASGDELLSCRPSHVQYRPQSDLVVRYRCEIRRNGASSHDTLLAATTVNGPFAGTVPIEAETPEGTTLSVGVWRWPFDPILTDLATMVTPHLAAQHLASLVGGRPHLEVVAYRPTERAVVRVVGPDREVYVKVVPPASTDALVARHRQLISAGLPVPRALDAGDGWIAMEALVGTTLRERLKSGDGPLPAPDRYRELLAALAAVDVPGAPHVRSRIDDAPHHAAMLATVLPDDRDRLGEIAERLGSGGHRAVGTVHGDLHEAQLVVDDERVIGLLDIDDVGPGDPLDDVGTLVAHLRFRAATSEAPAEHIERYAVATRAAVAAGHDPADVDRHVAAVLVGLATGPFRIQQPQWASTTRRVLDLVEEHLDAADRTVGTR